MSVESDSDGGQLARSLFQPFRHTRRGTPEGEALIGR